MSTSCSIFYKNQEGKYQGIFCHYNGMPEYTAGILYHHYQDESLVRQLIQLGGIFHVKEDIREIITFRSALNNKIIDKKRRTLGWKALSDDEKRRIFYYDSAKGWKNYHTKWLFFSEEAMLNAWDSWEDTEYFLDSQYIYVYNATKKGKNKWEIFYQGKTKHIHRNITPSLIKHFEEE